MEAPRSSKGPRGPAVRLPARGDDTLEQALAKAGDGAFVVAEDGCVRLWNRAAERILRWTARLRPRRRRGPQVERCRSQAHPARLDLGGSHAPGVCH